MSDVYPIAASLAAVTAVSRLLYILHEKGLLTQAEAELVVTDAEASLRKHQNLEARLATSILSLMKDWQKKPAD